ncbi:P-loop containing nucleoside triphosphate hydrolase protein [Abortiporus biennis]|nr:P-loop containing nucleoside triphosphate hydrolase protein [Abortiporus biennis]
MSVPPTTEHMLKHVLEQLSQHRSQYPPDIKSVPPLSVGVQGPQGSGKTYSTHHLHKALSASPYHLKVVVISIDDLYLPHKGLVSLAQSYPQNALWKGRGQPGTHDIELGTEILMELERINEHSTGTDDVEVRLPLFDKSLHFGEGDRVEGGGAIIKGPVDVVVLEGWCVGFYPISTDEIDERWEKPVSGLGDNFFERRGFRKEDVEAVNKKLEEYLVWWNFLDVFIQITPEESHPYIHIYKWRLQQEHHMKSLNGGRGMTDDQIESFIDRYIPGYVFFGDGVTQGRLSEDESRQYPPWKGRGLRIEINEDREIVEVSHF